MNYAILTCNFWNATNFHCWAIVIDPPDHILVLCVYENDCKQDGHHKMVGYFYGWCSNYTLYRYFKPDGSMNYSILS